MARRSRFELESTSLAAACRELAAKLSTAASGIEGVKTQESLVFYCGGLANPIAEFVHDFGCTLSKLGLDEAEIQAIRASMITTLEGAMTAPAPPADSGDFVTTQTNGAPPDEHPV